MHEEAVCCVLGNALAGMRQVLGAVRLKQQVDVRLHTIL
jgi:hypothetical protein